jgi:hypothetical protein
MHDEVPPLADAGTDEPGARDGASEEPLRGLNTRQEAALVALLNEPTVARAAKAAGVGERTLHRWLTEEPFARAYREARRGVFQQAVSLTQRYASLAVQTLAKVMTEASSPWNAKVAASSALLRFGREGIELEDMEARIEALERRSAPGPGTEGRPWQA